MKEDYEYMIPSEYKPISPWGYFGYQILFSIPILGFIILICVAICASNRNLRNFARSYFCFIILIAVFLAILLLFGSAYISNIFGKFRDLM